MNMAIFSHLGRYMLLGRTRGRQPGQPLKAGSIPPLKTS